MSAGQRQSDRFTVVPSTGLMMWGLGLVVGGMLAREIAAQRHLELMIAGDDSGWWTVGVAGLVVAVVGLGVLVLGIGRLSSNVDYLAAREADRHRVEARSVEARSVAAHSAD